MILLAGVTGRVGRAAANALLADGQRVRGLVRDPARVGDGLDGLETVVGDMADRTSLDTAMQGISAALLVVANSEQQLTLERNFIESATAAGVPHLVKISSMEAGPDAAAPIPKLHYQAEQMIEQSGVAWTMLQPNFFLQNLLLYAQSIAKANQFALPFGDALVAPVDCADVGAAAAQVLTDPNAHAGVTYQLTGMELMGFAEVAATMSQLCGRQIRYIDQPAEEFRAFLANFISSDWHVNAVCELFAEIKKGALATVTDQLPRLLDRQPNSLADFVERHQTAFAAA